MTSSAVQPDMIRLFFAGDHVAATWEHENATLAGRAPTVARVVGPGTDSGEQVAPVSASSMFDNIALSELTAGALRLTGMQAGDSLGHAVAAAGDVNGDGLMDFLVSAPLADTPANASGAVWLVYGQQDWVW